MDLCSVTSSVGGLVFAVWIPILLSVYELFRLFSTGKEKVRRKVRLNIPFYACMTGISDCFVDFIGLSARKIEMKEENGKNLMVDCSLLTGLMAQDLRIPAHFDPEE